MTLQQLKYIIAINRHRSFAKAAIATGCSQPTLSAMLAKLEEELDIRIFERNNKNVLPTPTGRKIIRQAERTVAEAERITELIVENKKSITGPMYLAISPNIAPYILPQFIRHYLEDYPQVDLSIQEMKVEEMFETLARGQTDAGITIGGNNRQGLLEIPLYTEKFLVYLSESCWRKLPAFSPKQLEHENMWIMKEAQCLRESTFSFCKARAKGRHIYEAGSIETLIRIVDLNGGFTIIPEMHLPMLTDLQRQNVRRIEGDHLSHRLVSLYIREDYVRERMIGTITGTLLKFIPEEMMEPRIAKFDIKL